MFSRARTLTLSATAAAAAAQVFFVTVNDEWDDVRHAASAFPRRALAAVGALPPPAAKKPRVVVLGSGWAALSFVRKLDQSAVDVTIVSPRSFFFYTPLLAGTATGTVAASSIVEPIRWYTTRAGHAGANFVQAEVASVDPGAKRVSLELATAVSGPRAEPAALSLDYDYLVVAVGAEPATFGIPGVKEHAHFIKEVEDGIAIQRRLLSSLELAGALDAAAAAAPAAARHTLDAEVSRLLSWVVIGGGPTGVELTAELCDFLRAEVSRYFPTLAPRVSITLVEAAPRLLGVFDATLAATATATLTRLGARIETNAAVTRVTPESVDIRRMTGDREPGKIVAGTVVWAGGIARRPVVAALAAALDPAGTAQTSRHGLLVDPWFRVKGVADNNVFAIGDCAVSGCAPTAQAAVQQGRFLGRAFRDGLSALAGAADPATGGVAPFVFRPKGSLAYTGGGTGIAELKSIIWDAHPGGSGTDAAAAAAAAAAATTRVDGIPAFAIWRSLYFSGILSTTNAFRVVFDWSKTALFGRDISTPYITPGSGAAARKPVIA